MNKMKDMRAGIEEMRSVAQRLLTWAEDMEKSLAADTPDLAPEKTAVPGEAESVVPSRTDVKVLLTKLCAAGYSAQVKALIASFGAASLSAVPEESIGELWDAAQLLGNDGGDADAG